METSRWFGMKETNRDYNYCVKTMQKGQGQPGKKITNLKSLTKTQQRVQFPNVPWPLKVQPLLSKSFSKGCQNTALWVFSLEWPPGVTSFRTIWDWRETAMKKKLVARLASNFFSVPAKLVSRCFVTDTFFRSSLPPISCWRDWRHLRRPTPLLSPGWTCPFSNECNTGQNLVDIKFAI